LPSRPPDPPIENRSQPQKAHRYEHNYALRNCGVRFIEVETLEEYDRALTERTVMAHFLEKAFVRRVNRRIPILTM